METKFNIEYKLRTLEEIVARIRNGRELDQLEPDERKTVDTYITRIETLTWVLLGE